MNRMDQFQRTIQYLLPALLLLPGCAREAVGPQLTVFLVRHAETVDASPDPGLSDAGKARAGELATLLRDTGIDRILSSDYRRTRDTAAPIALQLGLEVELYEPDDLGVLAEQIRASTGRTLVVGHSNTTPQLVQLLGGDPGSEIDESEYDRLYVVTIGPDGAMSTLLLRYGDS